MRIYKTLPDLEQRKQMALWHKALKVTWSPKDIDFSAPGAAGALGVAGGAGPQKWKDHLARALSPILMGEQAGLYSITNIIRALGRTSEVEGQLFLTTMLVDEAKHVELFTRYYHRIERDPLSIRRFPPGYLFQSAIMSDDPIEWLTGSLVSEVLAKQSLEEIRRLEIDPLLCTLIDRVLEDESRHLGFNHVFLADRFEQGFSKSVRDAGALADKLTTRLEAVLDRVPAILDGLETDMRELGMMDKHTFFETLREDCRRRLSKSIGSGRKAFQAAAE